MIEARITITTTTGTRTSDYRLLTTLLDPGTHPAAQLITLYHQRWEIETAYLELKSSILGGRVLRSRTPDGIDQEIHALLITYHCCAPPWPTPPTASPVSTRTGPASPPP